MAGLISRALYAGITILACALATGAVRAQALVEESSPGKRVAIVVGNADYGSPGLGDLRNAGRDGDAVAERLERLNFTVFHASDVSRAGFEEVIAKAEADLEHAEALVVYYSGHGFQLAGENYLVPVDFDAASAAEATADALPLSALIERLSDRDRPLLIFLDACRNSPLPTSVGGADRAKGLAQVEVGDNVFVAFATRPGMVSYEGGDALSSQLSPFTHALVKFIEQPGLDVFDMSIRVRIETEALTIGRQSPWNQDSLLQQFYFTEQQQIEPQLLLAGLRAIEADPVRKDRFRRELEANPSSLQALVFSFVSEMNEAAPELVVAHNDLATSDVKSLLAPDLERLIREPEQPEAGAPIDLVKTVQGELRRLGCYRMAIDGDWGKGSRKALGDFYRETGQAATDLEPSLDALTALYMQPGRVCRAPAPVVRKASVERDRAPTVKRTGAQPPRAVKPAQPARKPLPLPPDIGAGIGIGGVF
jgi:hypothetical protein